MGAECYLSFWHYLVTMSSYSISSHSSSLILTVAKYHQHLRAEYGDMKYCHLQTHPLFKVIP